MTFAHGEGAKLTKTSVGAGLTLGLSTGFSCGLHVWAPVIALTLHTSDSVLAAGLSAEDGANSAPSCHCHTWKNSPPVSRRARRRMNPGATYCPGAKPPSP